MNRSKIMKKAHVDARCCIKIGKFSVYRQAFSHCLKMRWQEEKQIADWNIKHRPAWEASRQEIARLMRENEVKVASLYGTELSKGSTGESWWDEV